MKTITVLLAMFLLMSCADEPVAITGTVIGHSTASDKYGSQYYHTIIKEDKGGYVDVKNIEFYYIPVGTHVDIKTDWWRITR